jgi:F subunit of K+-transporting ATPase (Potass_KdpF)
MSGADLFGLIASALVCLYLLYALLRGERFQMTFLGWVTISPA